MSGFVATAASSETATGSAVGGSTTIPAVVLGGSGYVAGELLRLLAGHPAFAVVAVSSTSRAGEPVVASFPHLRGTRFEGVSFASGAAVERALGGGSAGAGATAGAVALFSALPHGEAAASLAPILTDAERSGRDLRVVDLSADFRHRDADRYAALYGKAHAAPELLARFVCALPEHGGAGEAAPRWVAHPGCFTTAATLALAPLVAGGWIEPPATVVAVTGSTGAGRTPSATTHHPERRSDLFAYSPFTHRHEPEMRALVAAAAGSAAEPEILFVPHSGPFARGIHATITARLARPGHSDEIAQFVASFYESLSPLPSSSPGASSFSAAASPSFVHVLAAPPRLQAVVGTNRCDLAFAVRDDRLVAFAAIDNLVKGAAGGAIQWMNRLCGLPEASGLTLPGLGWL